MGVDWERMASQCAANGGTQRVSQSIRGFDEISSEGTHIVSGKAEMKAI